jgi:hypothetical protein
MVPVGTKNGRTGQVTRHLALAKTVITPSSYRAIAEKGEAVGTTGGKAYGISQVSRDR